MSVISPDLVIYGSANMPDADALTTGGAVDFTKRVLFNDITPNGLMDYVSSNGSDTAATIALTGADASGATVVENKTFNGTTVVNGTQTFSELLKGVIAGTTAVGDLAAISHTAVLTARTAQAGAAATSIAGATITLQSGDGASVAAGMILRVTNNSPVGVQNQLRQIVSVSGDVVTVNRDWGTVPTSATQYGVFHGMLFDLLPNQVTQVRRPFYQVSSDVAGGSQRVFYEKVFAVNNDTTISLILAQIIKQADPASGTLDFALTNNLNDVITAANRQTAPTGATAFSSGAAPQTINIPAPQNLPSGAAPNSAGAQGIWLRWTLAAGLAPAKTAFTLRINGSTR